MLALAFATFAVLPLNYGWAVLFLTPLVVLMVSFALGAGPAVAIDRIVDTLIGGAIAVAAATLLWPRSERGDFGPALGRALALDREYVSAVLAGRDAAPAGRRAATAADDLEARYRRLAGEPHRGRRGIGAVWEAVAANRRLYLATVALDAQLGGLGAEVFQGWTRSRRGCAMRSTPSPMANPLHSTRASAPLTGLRADVLALAERRTHELRANTALTPTAATLRRQALVLAQFDACGAALYRLRSAVRELSPSAA
ncbi:MAG: FUSC family protein [Solirubrobacteraceae bacterium]